jgi:hypothetical protein
MRCTGTEEQAAISRHHWFMGVMRDPFYGDIAARALESLANTADRLLAETMMVERIQAEWQSRDDHDFMMMLEAEREYQDNLDYERDLAYWSYYDE